MILGSNVSSATNVKEIPMDMLRNCRTNSTNWRRCPTTPQVTHESAAINPARTQESNVMKRGSLLLAVVVAAIALLPLSLYARGGGHDDDATNSRAAQAPAADNEVQFDLVPASAAIANCFPNAAAKVKVLLTADE